jgi:hypothetical protein
MGSAMPSPRACQHGTEQVVKRCAEKRSPHLPGGIEHNGAGAPPPKGAALYNRCGRVEQVRRDKTEGQQIFGLLQPPMMVSDALGCNHPWAGRAYCVAKRRVNPHSLNVG